VNADKAIRRLAAAAVLLVATIAAVVSFIHIQHLAVTHGQTQLAAYLLPVSVDGTVAAASCSMLWAARAGMATPRLARAMLTLGVLATLAANVGYGAPYGLSGELLSGWPAVAFVGSVEMVLGMIRRTRTSGPIGPEVDALSPPDAQSAALAWLRDTIAVGNPASGRQLETRFGLSRAERARVQELAASNGHTPDVPGAGPVA
jgi:hypothetical protein